MSTFFIYKTTCLTLLFYKGHNNL